MYEYILQVCLAMYVLYIVCVCEGLPSPGVSAGDVVLSRHQDRL